MECIYYCTGCGHVESLEIPNPYDEVQCSQCHATLSYTGCSKEVWDQKTKAEQDEIKNHLIVSYYPSSIKQIATDTNTIKNILIFFVTIWGISILVSLISSLS